MAQNNTKSLKGGAAGKSGSGGRKNAGITKKGKRAVAPKDLAGIRKTQVQKVCERGRNGDQVAMPLRSQNHTDLSTFSRSTLLLHVLYLPFTEIVLVNQQEHRASDGASCQIRQAHNHEGRRTG